MTGDARRRILLVVFALLTVPLSAVTGSPSGPSPQFTLANGLNVILHRDTSIPVVAVNVMPTSARPTRNQDERDSRISSNT